MSSLALNFNNVQFNIVDHLGQIWLRASEIGDALGYKKAGRVSIDKLYKSNADEFSNNMTALIKQPDLNPQNGDAGQMREIRIFSLRGCHLIAMFARTAIAKQFRKWVLDVLDKEVATNSRPQQLNLPTMSDKRTRVPVKDAVTLLVAKSRNMNYSEAYSLIHQRFDVDSVEDLTNEQLPAVVEYIHKVIGEFIGKAELPAPARLPIDFPASWILENEGNKAVIKNANRVNGQLRLSLDNLTNPDFRLPTREILNILKREGYCVEAAEAELFALYSQLSQCKKMFVSLDAFLQGAQTLPNKAIHGYHMVAPVIAA